MFSVDTDDGEFIADELAHEQNLTNLRAFSDKLAARAPLVLGDHYKE